MSINGIVSYRRIWRNLRTIRSKLRSWGWRRPKPFSKNSCGRWRKGRHEWTRRRREIRMTLTNSGKMLPINTMLTRIWKIIRSSCWKAVPEKLRRTCGHNRRKLTVKSRSWWGWPRISEKSRCRSTTSPSRRRRMTSRWRRRTWRRCRSRMHRQSNSTKIDWARWRSVSKISKTITSSHTSTRQNRINRSSTTRRRKPTSRRSYRPSPFRTSGSSTLGLLAKI